MLKRSVVQVCHCKQSCVHCVNKIYSCSFTKLVHVFLTSLSSYFENISACLSTSTPGLVCCWCSLHAAVCILFIEPHAGEHLPNTRQTETVCDISLAGLSLVSTAGWRVPFPPLTWPIVCFFCGQEPKPDTNKRTTPFLPSWGWRQEAKKSINSLSTFQCWAKQCEALSLTSCVLSWAFPIHIWWRNICLSGSGENKGPINSTSFGRWGSGK